MRAGAATTHAMANAHGHRWKATPAATRQATATTAAGTTNTGCSETSVPARSTDECSRRTARTTVPPTHRTAATRVADDQQDPQPGRGHEGRDRLAIHTRSLGRSTPDWSPLAA